MDGLIDLNLDLDSNPYPLPPSTYPSPQAPHPHRSGDWSVDCAVTPAPFPIDPSIFYSPTETYPEERDAQCNAPAPETSFDISSPPMEGPSSGQGIIDFSRPGGSGEPTSPRRREWQEQGKPWAACACTHKTPPLRMDHHWKFSCPSNPNPARFECNDPSCGCGRKFTTVWSLKRHVQKHQEQSNGAAMTGSSPSDAV
ncbi:hypothetical protein FRB95_003476 [Tulasnella sp. JGI-2019a]|nr:hypothetical protein FRB95_003476 [Tulasnella sp. JGI-2019a]